MSLFYILDGKIAKQCSNVVEWGAWMETADRRVAYDEIDGIVISTVFLGLDHNLFGNGDPLLFETMTFSPCNWVGDEQWRYFTWEEAEAGHRKMVELIRQKKRAADSQAAAVLTNLQLIGNAKKD